MKEKSCDALPDQKSDLRTAELVGRIQMLEAWQRGVNKALLARADGVIGYRIRRADGAYLWEKPVSHGIELEWTENINRAGFWLRRKRANEALLEVQDLNTAEVLSCCIVEREWKMCKRCGLTEHKAESCVTAALTRMIDGEILADLEEAIEAFVRT